MKSEILISKSETNPNYTNLNVQKKHRFWILDSGFSILDARYSILDGCDCSLVNLVNMGNMVKWFRPRKAGSSILTPLEYKAL